MQFDEFNKEIIQTLVKSKVIGSTIIFFDTTESTMDEARYLARNNYPEGAIVVANQQTSGRGRFERAWISPPDVNLYMSIVLRPKAEHINQMAMMSSLALAKIITNVVKNKRISIKWPNDVKIDNKKVAGILIESYFGSDAQSSHSIIGIGINVNFDTEQNPDIANLATSILNETGGIFPRAKLLQMVLSEMENLYLDVTNDKPIIEDWLSFLDTVGNRVEIKWGESRYEGHAESVDKDGSLLLRLDDGSVKVLPAGEVTLRN